MSCFDKSHHFDSGWTYSGFKTWLALFAFLKSHASILPFQIEPQLQPGIKTSYPNSFTVMWPLRRASDCVQLLEGVLKGVVRGRRPLLPPPPSSRWKCRCDGWPQTANLDHEVEAMHWGWHSSRTEGAWLFGNLDSHPCSSFMWEKTKMFYLSHKCTLTYSWVWSWSTQGHLMKLAFYFIYFFFFSSFYFFLFLNFT